MAVKLELYRVFKEVADTGNISAAAKNLYISQSAVSQSIKQLETALQARLFARSPRGVALTSMSAAPVAFWPPARISSPRPSSCSLALWSSAPATPSPAFSLPPSWSSSTGNTPASICASSAAAAPRC